MLLLIPKTSEDMEALTVEARRICQCLGCWGGYAIGARTIAIGMTDATTPPQEFERPSSCLAGVLLEAMLRLGATEGPQ